MARLVQCPPQPALADHERRAARFLRRQELSGGPGAGEAVLVLDLDAQPL